ncbi:hypothetical protein C0J52_06310 [Blattella germanica]|nr:hypothetical protein C0J52_06310 [Blattella germanica]
MSLSLLVLCSLLLDLASSSPVEPAGAPSEEYCSYCIDTNSEFCCRFFNTCCSYVSPCPSPARPQTSACEMKKCTRSSECRRGQSTEKTPTDLTSTTSSGQLTTKEH